MLYKKISELTQEDMEHIMLREVEFFKVMDDVSVIINEVKKEGDDALKKFTKEFDGADIVNIEVEDIEIENAYEEVEPELIEALENAAANIAAYHGSQVEAGLSLTEVEPGLTLGYKVTPIASVGVYVPGGTAAYPSNSRICKNGVSPECRPFHKEILCANNKRIRAKKFEGYYCQIG